MKTARSMNRRRFLLLGAGAGALLVAPSGLSWFAAVRPDRPRTAGRRLKMLFRHQDSARAIGRTYLERYPHEADIQVLLGQIAGADGGEDRITRAVDRRLRSLLQNRIRQDFAQDNIVKLHGWILSATEARLYALAALA